MTNGERTVTVSIPVPFMLNDFESLTQAALEVQGVADWEVADVLSAGTSPLNAWQPGNTA
jgi:hypothetical protein